MANDLYSLLAESALAASQAPRGEDTTEHGKPSGETYTAAVETVDTDHSSALLLEGMWP
jgi:hypothetical protein